MKKTSLTWTHRITALSFSLFFLFGLTTPSWRYGPFAWIPLWTFDDFAGAPLVLGILNLLPLIIAGGIFIRHLPVRPSRAAWRWGTKQTTLPFLGLSILGIVSLDPSFPRNLFIQVGGLLLAWLVYLYVVNERPNLTWPLSLVVLIQSGVALGQFFSQRDLGLEKWGELPLHPAWQGITVLFARDTRWLRAYGLTAHPNLLGAILSMALLLLIPAYARKQPVTLMLVLAVGLMALFVTFSRAAWLAFSIGLLAWMIFDFKKFPKRWRYFIKLALPYVPALILLLVYHDLAFSRFIALDTPTETQSLIQRRENSSLALALIRQHPWTGVGLGNYPNAVLQTTGLPGAVRVHNVPLLVTAELGIIGLALWLWLTIAPMLRLFSALLPRPMVALRVKSHSFVVTPTPIDASQIAPWLAMFIINLFDTMVWFSSNWQTSILFALMVAHLTWPVVQNRDWRLEIGAQDHLQSPISNLQSPQ